MKTSSRLPEGAPSRVDEGGAGAPLRPSFRDPWARLKKPGAASVPRTTAHLNGPARFDRPNADLFDRDRGRGARARNLARRQPRSGGRRERIGSHRAFVLYRWGVERQPLAAMPGSCELRRRNDRLPLWPRPPRERHSSSVEAEGTERERVLPPTGADPRARVGAAQPVRYEGGGSRAGHRRTVGFSVLPGVRTGEQRGRQVLSVVRASNTGAGPPGRYRDEPVDGAALGHLKGRSPNRSQVADQSPSATTASDREF
jgi:hypothetical protein